VILNINQCIAYGTIIILLKVNRIEIFQQLLICWFFHFWAYCHIRTYIVNFHSLENGDISNQQRWFWITPMNMFHYIRHYRMPWLFRPKCTRTGLDGTESLSQ
jgi:hypothetical protein